jgi:hypothetical protein
VGTNVARSPPQEFPGAVRMTGNGGGCVDVRNRRVGVTSSSARDAAAVWQLTAISLGDENRRKGRRTSLRVMVAGWD